MFWVEHAFHPILTAVSSLSFRHREEIALEEGLVARLGVLGEIQVVMGGAVVPTEKVYGEVSAPAKWRKITILQRRNVDTKLLQNTRALGKEVFSEMGPESEEGLFAFLTGKLKK